MGMLISPWYHLAHPTVQHILQTTSLILAIDTSSVPLVPSFSFLVETVLLGTVLVFEPAIANLRSWNREAYPYLTLQLHCHHPRTFYRSI